LDDKVDYQAMSNEEFQAYANKLRKRIDIRSNAAIIMSVISILLFFLRHLLDK